MGNQLGFRFELKGSVVERMSDDALILLHNHITRKWVMVHTIGDNSAYDRNVPQEQRGAYQRRAAYFKRLEEKVGHEMFIRRFGCTPKEFNKRKA